MPSLKELQDLYSKNNLGGFTLYHDNNDTFLRLPEFGGQAGYVVKNQDLSGLDMSKINDVGALNWNGAGGISGTHADENWQKAAQKAQGVNFQDIINKLSGQANAKIQQDISSNASNEINKIIDQYRGGTGNYDFDPELLKRAGLSNQAIRNGAYVNLNDYNAGQAIKNDPNQVNIGTADKPMYVPKGSAAQQNYLNPTDAVANYAKQQKQYVGETIQTAKIAAEKEAQAKVQSGVQAAGMTQTGATKEQWVQKPGGQAVLLSQSGYKTLQDAANQGYSPVATPATTQTPSTSTMDTLMNYDVAAERKKVEGEQGISTLTETSNNLQNELLKMKDALDLKGITDKIAIEKMSEEPVQLSVINLRQQDYTADQYLEDAMNIYKYNTKLTELNLAQGRLAQAQNIVQQTAQDYKETAMMKLQMLEYQNKLDRQEVEDYRYQIEQDTAKAEKGFVYISNLDLLSQYVKKYGEQYIYTDPNGKKYLRPEAIEFERYKQKQKEELDLYTQKKEIDAQYKTSTNKTSSGSGGGGGTDGSGGNEIQSDLDVANELIKENPSLYNELRQDFIKIHGSDKAFKNYITKPTTQEIKEKKTNEDENKVRQYLQAREGNQALQENLEIIKDWIKKNTTNSLSEIQIDDLMFEYGFFDPLK